MSGSINDISARMEQRKQRILEEQKQFDRVDFSHEYVSFTHRLFIVSFRNKKSMHKILMQSVNFQK